VAVSWSKDHECILAGKGKLLALLASLMTIQVAKSERVPPVSGLARAPTDCRDGQTGIKVAFCPVKPSVSGWLLLGLLVNGGW
jgi:hypothetical protein